jgi:predicted nuclease of predicted toxin-antitoxin system
MNLPPSVVAGLRAAGLAATHARDRGLGTASDEAIVEHARARGETIVTNDLDFGGILAASGSSAPSVVILRLRDTHPDRLVERLVLCLARVEDALASGAIVVVEESTIRVRQLPV